MIGLPSVRMEDWVAGLSQVEFHTRTEKKNSGQSKTGEKIENPKLEGYQGCTLQVPNSGLLVSKQEKEKNRKRGVGKGREGAKKEVCESEKERVEDRRGKERRKLGY